MGPLAILGRMSGVHQRLVAGVRRRSVAGAIVAISDQGQTEGAAIGVADSHSGRALTTPTVTHVASVTKPVVAASFILTAPSSLDTPVLGLLPELRAQWRASATLTPRQLLSHTAGLHRDLTPEVCASLGDGDEALAEAVRRIVSHRQELRPGRAWRYCNGGFWLAGLALARLTGVTFEQAVQKAVLGPAAMAHSGFESPAGAARGHSSGVPRDETYLRGRRPGGGLCSNAGDLLRFAEFVMDRPDLLAHMTTPITTTTWGSLYGLGWQLRGELVWHGGSWGGYRSCLLLAPARRFAAVALVNDEGGDSLVRELVSAELSAATGLRSPWKGMSRLGVAAGALSRAFLAKATRSMH
jgi:CubicO group peptidase (beta-lactamase class C family)